MSPQAFPHLLPAEGLIWANFLRKYGAQWDRFDYDIRVGQGHPIDPAWPDYVKAMVTRLSLKRIDAVGYLGNHPTIFEVTPRLGRTTAGALLAYRFLFKETFPSLDQPDLAAVGPRVDPDLARYLASEGVKIYLVPSILDDR